MKPPEQENVLGCDLNSRKIALFNYGDNSKHGATVIAVPIKVKDRPIICATLHSQFYQYAQAHSMVPLFIEEPLVGVNIKSSLLIAQVYGVVIAAASLAGMERVYPVHASTWKRETVGVLPRSDHKQHIRAWLERADPNAAELCGNDQDLIDSACIARYGRGVLRRSEYWSNP